MAAAEARAAWQRTANRFFVQEDAKRVPKLACPSSAYSLSKQADPVPENIPDRLENPDVGFNPLNRNSSFSNISPDFRWWLQIQPNCVYQMGLAHEQVDSGGAEMENFDAEVVKVPQKNENDVPFIGAEMGESYELLERDSTGSSASKKVDGIGFDSDSLWDGSGRSEPWWRVADEDELASLVSQKSLGFVENCDLPRPQIKSLKDPRTYLGNCDHVGILKASDEMKAQKSVLSSRKVDNKGFATLESACRTASYEDQGLFDLDNQSNDDTIQKGLAEPLGNDPTKAQLMEALRHSQTRAREAEKAAKQASEEREHILKLFFKQASHLFAYKQWFQLFQLENIYFHIKNTNMPLSCLFPVDLPFSPNKNRKLPNNRHKFEKGKKLGKRPPSGPYFGNFSVAFALGIGLVGAGLFLGWTLAWMLPFF